MTCRNVGLLSGLVACVLGSSLLLGAEPQPAPPRRGLGERAQRGAQSAANSPLPSIKHAGHERSYRLHRPANAVATKALPLVIVLHGLGADAALTEAVTGFNAVADKHQFVVAYPNGLGRMWRFWENRDPLKKDPLSVDDIGFLAALIDQLVKDSPVDAERVYVTGISNGAYMTNRLGLSLADKIAAIAPVAGTLPKFLSDKVKPPSLMPVLSIHGTDDKIVSHTGTDMFSKLGTCLSASANAQWWATANDCTAMSKIESLKDSTEDGTTVTRQTYATARGATLVTYYEIKGGGHTWPSGSFQPEFLLGKTCRDINASEIIWLFFQEHSRAAK